MTTRLCSLEMGQENKKNCATWSVDIPGLSQLCRGVWGAAPRLSTGVGFGAMPHALHRSRGSRGWPLGASIITIYPIYPHKYSPCNITLIVSYAQSPYILFLPPIQNLLYPGQFGAQPQCPLQERDTANPVGVQGTSTPRVEGLLWCRRDQQAHTSEWDQ